MIALKPCPFCGSSNLQIQKTRVYWVECEDCTAQTEWGRTQRIAVANWNKRC